MVGAAAAVRVDEDLDVGREAGTNRGVERGGQEVVVGVVAEAQHVVFTSDGFVAGQREERYQQSEVDYLVLDSRWALPSTAARSGRF